jgi:hypothetical protein
MVRISQSCLFCAALTLALVSGCKKTGTDTKSSTDAKSSNTGGVLVFEVEEIELVPGADKEVKVKTGKAESAEAPKESGLTAKVADGKVTVSAAKDAKEGTHEVKVKGGKKDATIKVKVKKPQK